MHVALGFVLLSTVMKWPPVQIVFECPRHKLMHNGITVRLQSLIICRIV